MADSRPGDLRSRRRHCRDYGAFASVSPGPTVSSYCFLKSSPVEREMFGNRSALQLPSPELVVLNEILFTKLFLRSQVRDSYAEQLACLVVLDLSEDNHAHRSIVARLRPRQT